MHTTENRLSVITPSFNQGRFIERTILSVLNQDVTLADHMIFDGGSIDGTLEILDRYSSRLTWVSEPDNGQAHAVNKGLMKASGDIIGWINSDDIYYPGTFRAVLNVFDTNPEINVVYGRANHIDETDRIIAPYETEQWDYKRLHDVCFICQPAVFFRKFIVDICGRLDEDLDFCMDYEYWLRIGRLYPFHYIPRFLAGSRFYPGTKTVGNRTAVHHEIGRMFQEKLGTVPSRWVFNYASAITDGTGLDRSTPSGNFYYTLIVSTVCIACFLKWNRRISLSEINVLLIWLGGAVKACLSNRKGAGD